METYEIINKATWNNYPKITAQQIVDEITKQLDNKYREENK